MDVVAGLLQNPGGVGEMLTSGSIPWGQVRAHQLLYGLPVVVMGGSVVGSVEGRAAAAEACRGADALAHLVNWCTHPPCLLPLLRPPPVSLVPQVMYCGLLTTDLALLLEVLALQNVSSVDAAIIYTLEPVAGAGLAWLVLGERLGPLGLAGAGIILASSVASQLLGAEDDDEGGPDPEGQPGPALLPEKAKVE